MPPKLRAMLRDLREMQTQLIPMKDKDGKVIDESGLDPFQRKAAEITKLLAAVSQDVDRLNQLRAQAPDGRDLATIRLANDNNKNLRKAGELWKEAKQICITAQTKKQWDTKTIDERKHKLTLLFNEMKTLTEKNSSVTIEKTSTEKEIETRKAERDKRKREKAAKAKRERRLKSGDGGGGGGDDRDLEAGDDVEMRPVGPASAEEQQFMAEVQKNRDDHDQMLDEILKGVNELGQIASELKTAIDVGSAMADELDTKMDKTIEKFKSSNARLQEILDETGGVSRWCPMLICFIILLALVGYMFKMLG